jgi:hypothetical protein
VKKYRPAGTVELEAPNLKMAPGSLFTVSSLVLATE